MAASRPQASRFGVDYVFPLIERYRQDDLARTLSATNAGWVNFADVRWERIEPRPPTRDRHDFRWQELDEAVRIWQRHGFNIVLSLRLGSGWFAGPIRERPSIGSPLVSLYVRNSDRLPALQHRASYRAWIGALVERYDGDGERDMPGLEAPILHYQVGNEYANPMFWTGSLDDYATLLADAREAARAAHPGASIVSNGIRWNDLFHDDPRAERFEERYQAFLERLPSDEWRRSWRRARAITEGTIALAPEYDILDAGGNGPFPSASEGYMAWVRSELSKTQARPRIWDMEARCEPPLAAEPHSRFHPELQIPDGARLVTVLRNGSHPAHALVRGWYRAEQARLLVRVFVTRFAAGFEKVFLGMPDDWDGTAGDLAAPNPFLGLVDRTGRPWPALHAFRRIQAELDGFQTAERRQAPEGVKLFRFTFADRPALWVAWLRQGRPKGPGSPPTTRQYRLDEAAAPVSIQAIPTTDEAPPTRVIPAGQEVLLELGPTPVLISASR